MRPSYVARTLVRKSLRQALNLPRRFLGTVAGAALFAVGSTALASETAALYQAYWSGLPAGDIKLVLQDDLGGYRDEIAIRSEGLTLQLHFE
jgi:hypothetical protein